MGFGIILLVRMVVVVVGIHIGVNYVVFFCFFLGCLFVGTSFMMSWVLS